ncbi:thioesterase domain-containing protein [Nocardia sp. AG03]|uniref:thioesterase domain-containing protein n=1 Tax=Nocardia sp. AG03 TaxID=3025312 RepID=UPI0024188D77|nr:thioesterase domain-containing protein [Nocardia sp. AG03]
MGIHDDPSDTAPACAWPADPDSCVSAPGLERATSAALAPVLPIRPRGGRVDGIPLFCLSGEVGPAWHFAELITVLEPRTPVYGLQTVPSTPVARTVRDAAKDFLAEIRRIAPQGPLQLLGWSAGGFVAHELAVALRTAGRDVSVVLLDTDPAASGVRIPAAWSAGEYVHRFGALLGVDTGTTTLDATAAAAAMAAALAGTVELTGADLDRLADASHTALRRVVGHRPSLLPGELTVCVAGRHHDGTERPDPGAAVRNWRPYVTGTVTGLVLDATPEELITPELFPEIADALVSARIRGRGSTSRDRRVPWR